MSYTGKYALAKHETLALKCEALERQLEEARDGEIEFLSNLYVYEENRGTIIAVRDRLKKLKEKGDE